MANPRQAERDSNDSVHETTRRAADQASQTSRAMSDTAERTARAGTEAFRRNAETMNSTWRNSSEAATRIAERSVDQFSKLFGLSGDTARETMRQSAGNVAGSARELDLRGRRPAECLRRMDAFRAEPHRGESRAFRGVPRLPYTAGVFGSANTRAPRQYGGPLARRAPLRPSIDKIGG